MTVAAGKTPFHSYYPGSAMVAEHLDFEFMSPADLVVEDSEGDVKALGNDYEITGDHRNGEASIRALVSVDPAVKWLVWSDTPPQQQLDLKASRVVPLDQYEKELDRRAIIEREANREASRSPKFPRGIAPVDFDDLSGLVEGELLQFRNGRISRADFASSASKYAAFTSSGRSLVGVEGSLPDGVPATAANIAVDAGGSVQASLDALHVDAALSRYVDAAAGSDDTGDGSSGSPYKTIQKAYDSLPRTIERQCIIWLAPGTYNENYLEGESDQSLFPRNAVLFARGRHTASRTQNNAGVMSGPVVIKSNGGDETDTFIETGSTLTYGVYGTGLGQLAVQGVTIRAGANATALLVAHRGFYLHTYDVPLDANGFTVDRMGYAESNGAQLEYTGLAGVIDGGSKGLDALVGSVINVSGTTVFRNCAQALHVDQGAVLKISLSGAGSHHTMVESSCSVGIYGEMGVVEIRGASASAEVKIAAPIQTFGTQVLGVYANALETIISRGGEWRLDNCGFDKQWSIYDTEVYLRDTNSFEVESGTGKSQSPQPLRVESGNYPYLEGSCTIIGSSDGLAQLAYTTWTVNGNGTSVAPNPNHNLHRVTGNGANRTGCLITATGAWEGREITVIGDTWGVEFVSGPQIDVPGGVMIGSGSGHRRSAIFRFLNGKWRLVGPGTATPAAPTYSAPVGGATVDAEARTSLAQLAGDLAALRTALVNASGAR